MLLLAYALGMLAHDIDNRIGKGRAIVVDLVVGDDLMRILGLSSEVSPSRFTED